MNIKTYKPICRAKDPKSSVITHHWLQVTCKKCRLLKRISPKLKNIVRNISVCEKRLKELKLIEQRYRNELEKAAIKTI